MLSASERLTIGPIIGWSALTNVSGRFSIDS